jgi:phosphoglycerate dehydrogenase-like enzyme
MVLATPLEEELCQLVEAREPRVELVRDHDLVPPQRYPGDHYGEPDWRRSTRGQAAFNAMLRSADALYGIPDLSPTLLAQVASENRDLRWVQAMASGAASLIQRAGLAREELDRIVFTTSAGVHAASLAEFAVFGVLAGAKQLPVLLEHKRKRLWADRWILGQVADQRVLVVGLGAIGQAVAKALNGLGAQVVGVNRSRKDLPAVSAVFGLDEIEDAARGCSALVAALPEAAETRDIVDGRVLRALERGATVVNVGRGSAVDEAALVEEAASGQVGFAALDVTQIEPLPMQSELWDLPNVVISPHTAALTVHEDRLIAELVADNAGRLLDGLSLRNAIDPDQLSK